MSIAYLGMNRAEQIPHLLKMAWNAPDFYFDSISLIRMEHWSIGRTVLLGDAAYCASPASGQGTSLALVGAYVLAGELAIASGDHHTAFACYERIMRGYVEANQEFALKAIKGFTPRTRTQVWLILGSHSKQAGNTGYLTEDIPFIHAFHLSFSDHMHRLISL